MWAFVPQISIGNQVVMIPPGSYETEGIERLIQQSLMTGSFSSVIVSNNKIELE